MRAGELNFDHLGKRVTVSGEQPNWSVTGALVAVAHHCPNLGPEYHFETVLTVALEKPDTQLSTIVVSPSAAAVVEN